MSSSPSPSLPSYRKPWLCCQDQVSLLRSRGLIIPDPAAAASFLEHVSYYRFSGYCLAFEQSRHTFLSGVTFEDIRAAYEFDRVLSDLITEGLETVEIDLRAAVANHFGARYGAFGHTVRTSFFRTFAHADWIDKLQTESRRSSEPFVTHFRAAYAEYPDLPIWMVTEIMSFGALSVMYAGMLRDDQKALAHRYGLQPGTLRSWMHHLVYVRNLGAHHARFWDRVWAVKPVLPYGPVWHPPHLPGNDRLFSALLILLRLMRRSTAAAPFVDQWRDRTKTHLAAPPNAPYALALMGLTTQWDRHPLWH